ncbi:obscurin-like [Periophthalmus magnuspinnatus]|uniref:obscurin-like n=1 Tax=Periophthalmus magnuspinnatus TaxID=409849 RepID=UPI0024371F19|nr:obscurin-like [Periophthalmus magnuspinnatus]
MGASLLWTLRSILFCVAVCKQTTVPTVSPGQLEVFVGESLSLICEVEGADTEWTYHWSRNRLNPPPTTREYRVSRVTESDTGAYSCRAQRGPHLTTVWSRTTTVTVLSESVFCLHCDFTKEQVNEDVAKGASSIAPFVFLSVDPVTNQSSAEDHVTSNDHTSSPNVFCVAVCKQTTVTGDRATLDVTQQSVYLREKVTVTCRGHGEKELKFYKNGKLVQQDKQHVLLLSSRTSTLKFNSVSKSDGGLYSCGASEETQSPEKELKVTESTRRVELTVSNTEIPVGGSVTLSCDVEEWNETLQWFRREPDSLFKEYNVSIVEQTLSVSHGVYFCRGKDDHFTTKQSNNVTVVNTVPTVSPGQLEVFVGESLSLICEVEGADTEWTYHWSRNRLNPPPTTREYRVSRVTESDTGAYSCRAQRGPHLTTVWSSTTTVTVLNASMNLQTPVQAVYRGDSVTLVCSGPAQRQLLFFKNGSPVQHQPQHKSTTTVQLKITVSESDEGQYSCGINEEVQSHPWRLTVTQTQRTVTVRPWPSVIPVGGSVTLSCDIEGFTGGYRWFRRGSSQTDTLPETSQRVSVSRGGEYSCRGQDQFILTPQSPAVTVRQTVPNTVSLTPNWSKLFVGESLSLICEVEGADTEWTYHWSRNRLNPPPTTREYRVSRVTESDTGAYRCRGVQPHAVTEWSDPSFVWSGDAESPVSLSVSPDRAQHFTDDVITLSCGFNSTGADSTVWRRFSDHRLSQQCKWSKSKCEFSLREETSAVFWCESGSGEMSNAVNISVHRDIILMSPVSAVTEGQSVSLSCKLNTGTFTSVQFYKNGKMIQNGTEPELNITAVSRSDQGFYKCEGQRKLRPTPKTVISPESWMSVKSAPKGERSALAVMWVVGPVCAVVLLTLLLLLWRFLKTKDLCFLRTNQSSAEDHVTSNDHTSSPNDVTYSVVELKSRRVRNNPPQDESCIYSDVIPHSSGTGFKTLYFYYKKSQIVHVAQW